MSIAEWPTRARTDFEGARPKKWTGEEYDRLVEIGAFDGMKIELLNGEIYEMSPMGDDHAQAITLTQYRLMGIFLADRFTVRVQIPFRLSESSRPEPDVAVYDVPLLRKKTNNDLPILAVEVSHSTLDYDREIKLPAYAARGIPEVWIHNLVDRVIEVYRSPHQRESGQWAYDRPLTRRVGDHVNLLAAPGATIAVAELMP